MEKPQTYQSLEEDVGRLIEEKHRLISELTALRTLLREMGDAINLLLKTSYWETSWIKRINSLETLLSRPEVRAVMEGKHGGL